MTKKADEYRVTVLKSNQFHLPKELIEEIGKKSGDRSPIDGACTSWFYHEEQDKAVLANPDVERESLEHIEKCTISGVSNDELESNDHHGGRVTILSELPDRICNSLRAEKHLILRVNYRSDFDRLNYTAVSVYPASKYVNGTLHNVYQKDIEDDTGRTVSTCSTHEDMI